MDANADTNTNAEVNTKTNTNTNETNTRIWDRRGSKVTLEIQAITITQAEANVNTETNMNAHTDTKANTTAKAISDLSESILVDNLDLSESTLCIGNIQNKIPKTKNKLIMYGDTFDSTKGFPGEGPISMKLTDKFFQCPTIMGEMWVKAVMNKKQANITINQMKILRSTSTYKNKRKKDGTPRPTQSINQMTRKVCQTKDIKQIMNTNIRTRKTDNKRHTRLQIGGLIILLLLTGVVNHLYNEQTSHSSVINSTKGCPRESPKYWLLPNYNTGTRTEIRRKK
jgi:hypothetical protein